MGARRGALTDDDVELIVFERGVEQFFELRLQAVDFVDEEDLFLAQVGEDGGQIALDLQGRTGCLLESDAEFVGDDGGQRGLAESGWTVEEDVVKRLTAASGGFDGDREVFLYLLLPD